MAEADEESYSITEDDDFAWFASDDGGGWNMRPLQGIMFLLTGRVVEGPRSEVTEEDDTRCDSFVLRVPLGSGAAETVDVAVDHHKDSAAPNWLSHMHVGSLVEAQLWMDPGAFTANDGKPATDIGGEALRVRVYDDRH